MPLFDDEDANLPDDVREARFRVAGTFLVEQWLGGEDAFIARALRAKIPQDLAERLYDELVMHEGFPTRAEMRQRAEAVVLAIDTKLAALAID